MNKPFENSYLVVNVFVEVVIGDNDNDDDDDDGSSRQTILKVKSL